MLRVKWYQNPLQPEYALDKYFCKYSYFPTVFSEVSSLNGLKWDQEPTWKEVMLGASRKTINLKCILWTCGAVKSGLLSISRNRLCWTGLKVFHSGKAPAAGWAPCLEEPLSWRPCRMDRALHMWMTRIWVTQSFGVHDLQSLSLSPPLCRGFLKVRPRLLFQEKGTGCSTVGNAFRLSGEDGAWNSHLDQNSTFQWVWEFLGIMYLRIIRNFLC